MALPKTSKPAERALKEAGYSNLDDIAGLDADVLLRLHGVGLLTIRLLDAALAEHDLPALQTHDLRHRTGGDAI